MRGERRRCPRCHTTLEFGRCPNPECFRWRSATCRCLACRTETGIVVRDSGTQRTKVWERNLEANVY